MLPGQCLLSKETNLGHVTMMNTGTSWMLLFDEALVNAGSYAPQVHWTLNSQRESEDHPKQTKWVARTAFRMTSY